MNTGTVPTALFVAICLALLSACGGGEEKATASPTPSPTADETALREAVTAYHRAIAGPDLATAYASESADFRETCPFDVYEDMLASLWPQFLDDCGFEDAPKVDFVIGEVEMQDDRALILGCWQDQSGRRCCYHEFAYQWNYRDGAWVPDNRLPCAYARENHRLLATLPELPGAEPVLFDSLPYSRGEGPADRHFIFITYKAPPEISAEGVIDFYVQSLAPEWQHTVRDTHDPSILVVDFTRGTALISIDTANMFESGPHTFDVYVDYKGAEQ